MIVILMGVCGCGKSTIGKMLADRLNTSFIEGDDIHPSANREKMASGFALGDDDRWPWLDAIVARADEHSAENGNIVISCSALKRVYRDRLRRTSQEVRFVHLTGNLNTLRARMAERQGHFMPLGLLDSQLAALEPLQEDEIPYTLAIECAPEELVNSIIEKMFDATIAVG